MTVTIPRAEIREIAGRYDDPLGYVFDPPAGHVRSLASDYRQQAAELTGTSDSDLTYRATLSAEADELDALVDRIENERDNHCIAYSEDPDTGKCECGHADDEHDRELRQCEAPLSQEASA